MARHQRLAIPGWPMHITQRGTDRMITFLDERDFAVYRACLQHASEREHVAIHAYVLMPNHIHLLVTPAREGGASRMMQSVGRLYVPYFNARHARTGTLWEGRFWSAVVDSSGYFLNCSRYVDLNAVRARLCARAEHYEWSSYAHLAHGTPDALVTLHGEYLALGRTPAERQDAYAAMCIPANANRFSAFIRHATHGGSMIGNARARAALAATLGRPVARLTHGGNRRRHDGPRPSAEHDYRSSTRPWRPSIVATSEGALH